MKGRIIKVANGWKYIVDVGKNPKTGNRARKSKSGFSTKKECQAALNEILIDLQKNQYIVESDMTVDKYLTYWLESYVAMNVAPLTEKRYTESCNDIKKGIGKIKLCELKPLHIQKLYAGLAKKGQSNKTILNTHRTLHLALKHAIMWQMIQSNPCELCKPPKPIISEMKVWTIEEAKDFLEDSNIKNESIYPIVALALQTGMREGECCAERWQNISLDSKDLSVKNTIIKDKGDWILKDTKTKKARNVALADKTVKLLKELKIEQAKNKIKHGKEYKKKVTICDVKKIPSSLNNDFVFTWEDGSIIDPNYVAKRFSKVIDKYNKLHRLKCKEKKIEEVDRFTKIRFHDLRHTHATLLLQQGVHPKIVSERLGHASVRITLDTYTHVLPTMQKEVADKIDNIL